MTRRALRFTAIVPFVVACACVTVPPKPVTAGGPLYPDYPSPVVPPALATDTTSTERVAAAWTAFQSGNTRGASQTLTAVLKQSPAFYPAETALGFIALANRQYRPAATRFSAALTHDQRYLPALEGLVIAQLELGNDAEAIVALERILAIEPKREADRARLDVLKFRQMQTTIENARRARRDGRLEQAEDLLTRALAQAPESAVILRELSAVEVARRQYDEAEAHARRAVELDRRDADNHVALAQALEAAGRLPEAASAWSAAADIDASYRDRADAARARVKTTDVGRVPVEIDNLAKAPRVTRGQFAALLGTRVGPLLERAPDRTPVIATDISGHWAAPWIAAAIEAGVMTVFPNRAFLPDGPVRRGDVAAVVLAAAPIALEGREADLARWRAARPDFADMPASHLAYRAAAFAVASGAMSADSDGGFSVSRYATGAEVTAAVARLEQWTKR